jgi:predicted glycogen debranching enzyme
MDISIDERTCLNIKEALRLEWLDTNGRGGYSSSTVLQCHTRKYHGLLVCELPDPPRKFVLLSKFEDSVIIRDQEFFLSLHRYPGMFYPYGHKYLREFHLRHGHPHFTYSIGGVCIHKSIIMLQGEDRVLIRYYCDRSDVPVLLRIKPLLAFRECHSLSKENMFLHVRTFPARNGFKIQPYDDMPPFFIQTDKRAEFYPSPLWYYNFEYVTEGERGYENHEDLFQPGVFEIPVRDKGTVYISASTKEAKSSFKNDWAREEQRRAGLSVIDEAIAKRAGKDVRGTFANLLSSGRHFPVKTASGRSDVIAGYHWFGCWGRDTMISLPGLAFCSGVPEQGAAVLKSIAGFEKNGLIPNFFSGDKGQSAYNSVDASLWFIWAVQQMAGHTGDFETIGREFLPVIRRIIGHYRSGTDFNIHADDNGLLHAGDEDTQLTWMDVIAGGRPVTPRSGCAVEINALWYNALRFADELGEKSGDSDPECRDLADRLSEAFNAVFWAPDLKCLGDCYRRGKLDRSVRPNQIFAVSLPYAVLHPSKWKMVVDRVAKDLLTPAGLRTLSPEDPAYRGRYEGNSAGRDLAYHQGTVWPWLMGAYGEAMLKAADDRDAAAKTLEEWLRRFLDEHMRAAGIGFVSEVFSGDPPHEPNGCIAQAWSSAELIRLWTLINEKPGRKPAARSRKK